MSINSISAGVAERAVPTAPVPTNRQSTIAIEQDTGSKSGPAAVVAIAQQTVQAKEQSSPDSSGTQQAEPRIPLIFRGGWEWGVIGRMCFSGRPMLRLVAGS